MIPDPAPTQAAPPVETPVASQTIDQTVEQTFDGATPPHAEVSALATLIGERYELREEIAEGGMGVVHRAIDRNLNREVALKLVKDPDAGESAMRRFRDEARITGQLQHPGIPPVHELGALADGHLCFSQGNFVGFERSGND